MITELWQDYSLFSVFSQGSISYNFTIRIGDRALKFFVVQGVINPKTLYQIWVEFHQKVIGAIVNLPCFAPPPLKNHFHEKFIIEPRLLKLNE